MSIQQTILPTILLNLSILIIGGSQSAKIFGDEIPKVIKKCHDQGIFFNLFQQCLDNQ